jgi:hypothetical protein
LMLHLEGLGSSLENVLSQGKGTAVER